MIADIAADLIRLLPEVIKWGKAQEIAILATGRPLTEIEAQFATEVGVRAPASVRLKIVATVPEPDHPEVRATARALGVIGPDTEGLTFGRGIYLLEASFSLRILLHELRHVHQVEEAGSVAAFLKGYVEEIAAHGYGDAPLEKDARAFEYDSPEIDEMLKDAARQTPGAQAASQLL